MANGKDKSRRVVVVGAGIAGVSSAIWLQREGCEVVLIDRLDPGEGASYGNAGVLASCSIVPVTTPGLALKAPSLAMRRDSPVFMIWRRLPVIAPWLVRYLLHANDGDTRRIAAGLAEIVGDSVRQHFALSEGTLAERWLQRSSYAFAYETREAFQADEYVWKLRRSAGMIPTVVEGPEVRDIAPELSERTQVLAIMGDHGFVRNPGQYVKDLASAFADSGGTVVKSAVRDFDLGSGRVRAVESGAGSFACDAAVIAAGVWSGSLMKKLGLRIPVESERGYHVLFRNPSVKPKFPIMIAAGKFVATPMEAGLRCAGVVEFGGIGELPTAAPLEFIRRKVGEAFPGLTWDDCDEWLGHRPAPCDSLPLIGEVGQTGVFTAFGHHHIGLTGGPKTGRTVARLITGGDPELNVTTFSPNRFRK